MNKVTISSAKDVDVSNHLLLCIFPSLFLSADDLLVLCIITYSCFGRRRRSRRILRARFSWERESAAFSPLCRWAGGNSEGGREGGATATAEALPPSLSSSVFGSPGRLVVWQISLGFLLRHLTVGGPLPRDVRS